MRVCMSAVLSVYGLPVARNDNEIISTFLFMENISNFIILMIKETCDFIICVVT